MRLLLRQGRVFDGSRFNTADIDVDGDRILEVGPRLQPRADDQTWDLAGDLVIPGLVNAHYHSPDNLITGRLPSAPLELWSLSSVPSRTSQPDELRIAALLGCADMLLGGVTSVVDLVRPSPKLTLSALDAVAEAYGQSGMRAAIAPVVRDLAVEHTLPLDDDDDSAPAPPEVDGAEQLNIIRTFSAVWHGRLGRLSVQVGPSGPQRCSDRLFQQALDLGAELRTLVHTHVLETRAQAVQAQRRWGASMLEHLDRLGALSERMVLAHVVWPESDQLRLLAERRPLVVHNPASNCTLGSGRAPLPGMLAAGVRLALGTDGATCNDGLSMFEAMKLGTILHRPFEADWHRWLSPSDTLRMATEGGAAALDLAGQLGRIAPGYLADLVVLDAHAPAFVPPNDLARQLVMRAGPSVVRHVFVHGQNVVRERQLLSFDWGAIAEAASAVANRHTSPEPTTTALVTRIEHMLRSLRPP